ncbi:hypothetical protein GCM10027610_077520 [Dactylosporangium cerinum]
MTNPAANTQMPGAAVHSANATACDTPAATSAPRRENRSASAPVGTSASSPTTDHSVNSSEICPSPSPVSVNSSAYSGYSGSASDSRAHPTARRANRPAGSAVRQPNGMRGTLPSRPLSGSRFPVRSAQRLSDLPKASAIGPVTSCPAPST